MANFYQYDASSRLTYADLRARNLSGNSAWSVQSSALPGNWTAGDYQRTYDFTGTGNDEYVRTSTTLVHATPMFPTPATGHDFGLPDAIGHVPDIDGVAREVDPMGNTIRTPGEHGILDLEYDGRRRLRKVTRDDGAIITYAYRSDGPLYRRTVTCDAPSSNPLVPPDFCEVSDTIYAYDGLLLRGEYDATQTPPVARALYYYADEGDIPIAADLWDDALQGLTRVYYVTDRQGSVLGLLNESGQWVERVWYDPWGRPVIESVEQAAPVISEILPAGPDSIYVVFSQPVVPVGSLVAAFAITAVNGGAVVNLVDATQVALTGKVPGTVVQVTAAAGGLVTNQEYDLTVAQGGLLNTWGYSGGGVSEIFEHSVARSYSGTVAPVYLERSRLGNGLLFHSHLYDYDADLVLARARVLDPRTGMFLQQDPEGYVDSANLYVGFRWDPVNLRDPTGREIGDMAFGVSVGLFMSPEAARLLAEAESHCTVCGGETIAGLGFGQALRGVGGAIEGAVDNPSTTNLRAMGPAVLLLILEGLKSVGRAKKRRRQPVKLQPQPPTAVEASHLGAHGLRAPKAPASKKKPKPTISSKPSTKRTGPVPAPKDLDGFQDFKRATPKSKVQGGGGLRQRWKDKKGNILEWDSQHGKVEKYDKRGRHLGEFDPKTGTQTKPADPTRKVDP